MKLKTFFFVFVLPWAAFWMTGCAGDQVYQETTYQDGIETSSAEVEVQRDGNQRILSGNPVEVVDDQVENASDLPYGGGEEGIRAEEDSR